MVFCASKEKENPKSLLTSTQGRQKKDCYQWWHISTLAANSICFSNIISKERLNGASEKVKRRMYLILKLITKQSSHHWLFYKYSMKSCKTWTLSNVQCCLLLLINILLQQLQFRQQFGATLQTRVWRSVYLKNNIQTNNVLFFFNLNHSSVVIWAWNCSVLILSEVVILFLG